MDNKIRRTLNLDLLSKKPSIFVSTEEALNDVQKIEWRDEIIKGEKKVIIKNQ